MPADNFQIAPERGEAKAAAHTPRFVILNDCERPEVRMIALVREAEGGVEWTYLSDDQRFKRSPYLKWNRVGYPEDLTDIEAFGVKPIIELRDGKHIVRVERVADSRATYRDGAPRKWQGHPDSVSTVRASLIADLSKPARSAIQRAGSGQ